MSPTRSIARVTVAPGPAYRIAFSIRFWATTRIIRGLIASSIPGSPSTTIATPARLARSSSSAAMTSSSGRTATEPSETTRVPDSSSLRNSTSSISSRICSTSARARSTSSATFSPGSVAVSRSDEQPREWRPQLVRDRGREAGPELLVRGEVAAARQVDEPLPAPVHVVRDDERDDPRLAGEEAVGQLHALLEALDRLPCAAAGREDAVLVVEDDDRLAALLEQHPAPRGVGVHAHRVLTDA